VNGFAVKRLVCGDPADGKLKYSHILILKAWGMMRRSNNLSVTDCEKNPIPKLALCEVVVAAD
jgi:hypothetical protein